MSSQSFILSYALAWNTLQIRNTLESILAWRISFDSRFDHVYPGRWSDRQQQQQQKQQRWKKCAPKSLTRQHIFHAQWLPILFYFIFCVCVFVFSKFLDWWQSASRTQTHVQYTVLKPISPAFIHFNIMPLISQIIRGKFLAHQLQFVNRIRTVAVIFVSSNCLNHFEDIGCWNNILMVLLRCVGVVGVWFIILEHYLSLSAVCSCW